MQLKLTKPEKTDAQLAALAMSGLKGAVKAREARAKRLHEKLRRELQQ